MNKFYQNRRKLNKRLVLKKLSIPMSLLIGVLSIPTRILAQSTSTEFSFSSLGALLHFDVSDNINTNNENILEFIYSHHRLKLAIVKLKPLEKISAGCKLVYLYEQETQTVDLQKTAKIRVLTFGDRENFLKYNGDISIVTNSKKMGLSIILKAFEITSIHQVLKFRALSAGV